MIQNNDKTTKEEDMTAEQELAKFLDTYLYDRLKSKCKDIKRITDKTLQMAGIDVRIEYLNEIHVNLDEKAQLHYMDICTDTFSFEIDFIGRDGNLHPGWLYNPDLKTDTYMLIWPKETSYHAIIQATDKSEQLNTIKKILRKIKCDDFKSVDCYLIKREEIKNFLASKKWDKERILEKAEELRASNKYGRTFVPETNLFYFYFSDSRYYNESPINIIIRKEKLRDLAHKKYVVSKDDLQIMP